MEKTETPFAVFLALFFTLFLVVYNYTLPMMGSIYIVGDLGGSNYITTYAVIFYSLGNALSVPLGKTLSARFGLIKLFLYCMLLFSLFSWICGISTNYPMFLTARFLQGFAAGPLYILISKLFSTLTPEDKKNALTSTILTIFAVSPVVGACWGGWISYDFHWRWVFYFDSPMILIVGFFVWSQLKKNQFSQEKTEFDVIGYVFYFIGAFCLCFALTTGQEFDWFRSPLIRTLFFIGIPCFIFFILWSLYHPYPAVSLALFKKPILSFALLNLGLLFSAYFGMVILLALWLSLYVNYTPLWVAVLIGNMALAGILPTFLIIRRFGKMDCRIPLTVAIIFLAISSFHTSIFDVDINFDRIVFSRVLAGFGLALFLPPIFRLCFRSFPEEKFLDVMVIFQIVRALSSGLGAAFYIILWQRRQVFYHDRLGSRLTEFSQPTQEFLANAKGYQIQGLAADAQLNTFLERQATALALDDCFYLMGWIMVGLIVLLAATLFFRADAFFPERKKETLYPKNI